MNCSRGMMSTDLFDSNQQRHWIPAVPVRLKTHLRIKQPAGKGFTCFLLQVISPQWCCLIAKNTYKKKNPGLSLQGEVEFHLIKSETFYKQSLILSKRKEELIFLKQISKIRIWSMVLATPRLWFDPCLGHSLKIWTQ